MQFLANEFNQHSLCEITTFVFKLNCIMRLKFVLSFLLIVFSAAGFSQVKPFRFGVRVAPNIAWISPDTKDYKNEGMQLGFSWGFMADITLTENYFIKTGFNIDYLNGKLSYPYQVDYDDVMPVIVTGTMNRKYNLRYIELPLTLKMRTNQFGNKAYFGEIGFGTSLNLKARGKDEFVPDDGSASTSSENDIKDDISLFKESLIIGGGIEFFIDESTSIVTSLAFNNGLTNILNGNDYVDPSLKQRANLYYFQLSIGILF